MDASAVIALIAAFVAAVATVHAERSANSAASSAHSAERANHIAQHNERLAIYKSLQRFRFEIVSHGHAFPETAIWPLADAANISEFYYPQRQFKALKEIVDAAVKVKGTHLLWIDHRDARVGNLAKPTLTALHAEMANLRKLCDDCDENLRAYLRMEPREES